jgi:hypothetical protein
MGETMEPNTGYLPGPIVVNVEALRVQDRVAPGLYRTLTSRLGNEFLSATPHDSRSGDGSKGNLFYTPTIIDQTKDYRLSVPDVPEYAAFCAGDMPACVFADWLEERIPDIPPELLNLLRGG